MLDEHTPGRTEEKRVSHSAKAAMCSTATGSTLPPMHARRNVRLPVTDMHCVDMHIREPCGRVYLVSALPPFDKVSTAVGARAAEQGGAEEGRTRQGTCTEECFLHSLRNDAHKKRARNHGNLLPSFKLADSCRTDLCNATYFSRYFVEKTVTLPI